MSTLRRGDKIGEISQIVINPRSKKVTHFVVEKGFLLKEDAVVPASRVAEKHDDRLVVSGDFNDFEPFEETHYVPSDAPMVDSTNPDPENHPPVPESYTSLYYYGPMNTWWSLPSSDLAPGGDVRYIQIVEENIPESAITLEEGMRVFTSDGDDVGQVEKIFTNPETRDVTHIQTSEGLIFKDQKLIPTQWIDTVRDDRIDLAISSDVINRLPEAEETQ